MHSRTLWNFVSAVFKVTWKKRPFNVSVNIQFHLHSLFDLNLQTYRGVGLLQVVTPVVMVTEPARTVEDLKPKREQLIMGNTCSEF